MKKKNYPFGDLPLYAVRGRNLDNTLFYINETQNLTADHIELLLGRCGKTAGYFDGDVRQVDSIKFGNDSGLVHLSNLRNSEEFNDMFTGIELKSIERSRIAKTSDYLNKLRTERYKDKKKK